MCAIDIILHPNPILRKAAKEVVDFNAVEVKEVIKNLQNAMGEYTHCVGLAANQIGSNLDIFIADASKNTRAVSEYRNILMINARIVLSDNFEVKREGCMSVPDLTGNISRAKKIEIKYFDELGQEILIEATDFEARVFQHEIDHLKGKIFLDRIQSARDLFPRKRYS